MDALVAHEASVRFYLLIGAFGLVAVWETLAPRRLPRPVARGRWGINIGLTLLLSVLVALVYPLLSVGMALAVARAGIGWLNAVVWPDPLEFGLALLVLDLGRYAQHVLLHRIPMLWRLHRVHHSDLDFDATTALRFHPLEALVTVGIQLALVAALGAPAAAVLVYEGIAALVGLFSHGNMRLPDNADRALRCAIVTPDMHRVHHSTVDHEANANYGSVLPWWDRVFGTYCAEPQLGHDAMAIGLANVRDDRANRVAWLLASPFLPVRRPPPVRC